MLIFLIFLILSMVFFFSALVYSDMNGNFDYSFLGLTVRIPLFLK